MRARNKHGCTVAYAASNPALREKIDRLEVEEEEAEIAKIKTDQSNRSHQLKNLGLLADVTKGMHTHQVSLAFRPAGCLCQAVPAQQATDVRAREHRLNKPKSDHMGSGD